MSEDDFMTLIKCLPLSPNIYNEEVLAAGCNLIASFCSDDLARHHFGERVTVSTVNLLKSLTKRSVKETSIQKCLLQTCRAVGNLCYYHGKYKIILGQKIRLASWHIFHLNIIFFIFHLKISDGCQNSDPYLY